MQIAAGQDPAPGAANVVSFYFTGAISSTQRVVAINGITKAPRSGERVYMLVGSDRSAPSWCPEGSRMQGIGVMQPDGLLLTSAVLWCMPDASELRYFHSDALRYDPQADTISDAEGVAFHRQVLLGR